MKTTSTPGVSVLAKEAVLGLGHLLGQHVKVAQLELKAEMHGMGRRAGLIAVLATLVALGYGLAMAGLAVLIGGHPTVGLPLVVIGLVHIAGAGVGLLFSPLRPRGGRLMDSSTAAMNSSLAALDKATAPDVSLSPESFPCPLTPRRKWIPRSRARACNSSIRASSLLFRWARWRRKSRAASTGDNGYGASLAWRLPLPLASGSFLDAEPET